MSSSTRLSVTRTVVGARSGEPEKNGAEAWREVGASTLPRLEAYV